MSSNPINALRYRTSLRRPGGKAELIGASALLSDEKRRCAWYATNPEYSGTTLTIADAYAQNRIVETFEGGSGQPAAILTFPEKH